MKSLRRLTSLHYPLQSSLPLTRGNRVARALGMLVPMIMAALFVLAPRAASAATLTTGPAGNPLSVITGLALTPVAFGVSGSIVPSFQSWELAGGSVLPPGLSFGSPTNRVTVAPSTVNVASPTLEGTPITAGTYTLRLVAYELPNRGGLSTETFTYVINVASSTDAVPTITTQPTTQLVTGGSTVTLRVVATGALSYQWQKNSVDILNAVTPTLTLTNVSTADSGTYTVVVRNTRGSVTSNPAILSIADNSGVLPTITTQPESKIAALGETVTFQVTATRATSYQWRKNSVDILGQISSFLTLNTVSALDAANYTVVVKNTAGQVISNVASLTINSTRPAITSQPVSLTVRVGASVALNVGTLNAVSFQWKKDGVALFGATASSLILPQAQTTSAGSYTVDVSNPDGIATSTAAIVTVVPTSTPDSRLTNLSVRTTLLSGTSLTLGFVTDGSKNILLRAVGPTLANYGETNFLLDPALTVYNGASTVVAQNDNWDASLSSSFTAVGAFPLIASSKDAALVRNVNGVTTTAISGTGSGNVLAEVYDADASTTTTHLTNVSARNRVGTGSDILISGFVIGGTVAKTVLIRGVGPTLRTAPFNITTAINDPKLEIHASVAGVDTKLAENDDWTSGAGAYFASVGAFALTANSKDAAILITLPPGAYTAQVSGVNSGVGDGIVEVYIVP